MDKTNRIVYGTPMMQSLRRCMGCFVVANELSDEEEKAELMRRCIGEFANVRMDLDFMKDENMFHFKKKKKKGEFDEEETSIINNRKGEYSPMVYGKDFLNKLKSDPLKDPRNIQKQLSKELKEKEEENKYKVSKWVEIYSLVALIDDGIRKYYNGISRGKSIVVSQH